jgi:para-nitrobenzyl esterase
MRRALPIALLLTTIACRRGPQETPRTPDPASLRNTPSGEVVGFVGRYGSHVWLGLPYAAPPVADLRWRAPQPPASWSGARPALANGAPCMQYASPFAGIQTAPVNTPVGSEDCLYANVYAPRDATPASRLPVLVWIHGGGNSVGAAELYDGGALATARNVVVVMVNYRLGPFGWFRHAALREGAADESERSGNFATLDLLRALEWVRDGVAAFGGDPGRVTIAGESAGGTNVLTLLLTPFARGLFQRAIVQSGGLDFTDAEVAEAFDDRAPSDLQNASSDVAARLLVHAGVAPDRTAAKTAIAAMPAPDLARRLRATPAIDVLAAYKPLPGMGLIRMPMVFRDGAVLPREPHLERFARADGWNRVPVILGTNRHESRIFMFGSPVWVRRWFGIIPRLRDPVRYEAVADHLSRMWKATGADEVATAMVASGARDVFVYRFDWDEEPTILGTDLSQMIGAGHGFEIPFVFGHFDLGREANRVFTADNEPGRRELSTAMMQRWAAFATSGDPGWTAWTASSPSFLVFDTTAGGGIRPATDTMTQERVLAEIEADPRLPTVRDRCLVYHDLVAMSAVLPRATFDAKCPGFAFDDYPWRD